MYRKIGTVDKLYFFHIKKNFEISVFVILRINCISKGRSTASKECIQEIKLQGLFMCSNVMLQHCPCPLLPDLADFYFLTDSKCIE